MSESQTDWFFFFSHNFHFSLIVFSAGNDHIFRLSKLKQQLQSLSLNIPATNQTDTASVNEGANLSQRDNIRNEIENILAAECLFCGEHMINQIDKPFIEDWNRVNIDWQ